MIDNKQPGIKKNKPFVLKRLGLSLESLPKLSRPKSGCLAQLSSRQGVFILEEKSYKYESGKERSGNRRTGSYI